jgi:hypothetical protein
VIAERLAAVREALDRGETVRAESCVAELLSLLRALGAGGASFTPGEINLWRAQLAGCLGRAQEQRRELAQRLQQAGAARAAIGRYGR